MAWGTDLLAGLGGAMQGGLAQRQQQKAEEYRRQRDEQIDDLKKQLAEMKGTQQLEQIDKRNLGKQALMQLANVGKLDLKRLDQEGDNYLEELHQKGQISLEEKMQIGRMSLAERNNAASQKRVETQGEFAQKRVETQGQTARDVASTQVGGDITTTGMRTKSAEEIAAEHEQGLQERAVQQGLQNVFGTTVRGVTARNRTAAGSGSRRNQVPLEKAPEWGDFIQKNLPPARVEQPGMPPQSLRPPTGQVPLNPPPSGGMSPAPPGGVPVAPQSAPAPRLPVTAPQGGAVAPRVPAPASPLFGPGSGGLGGLSAGQGGMPPAAPAPQAPAPGGGAMAATARVQMAQKIAALAAQIAKTPPGPARKALQDQAAALRAQAVAMPR